jgi:hypothetical protein
MQGSRSTWAWIGVTVVVVVLLFAWWYFMQGPAMPVYAPSGSLVPGFPPELVLDAPAQIDNSYSINYSSSANQLTAQWTSSSSIAAVFGDYTNYFQANGWSVSVPPITDPSSYSISATSSSAYALVNLVSQNGGTQVTVTYVKQ